MTKTIDVTKGMITRGKCNASENHSIAPIAMAAPNPATTPRQRLALATNSVCHDPSPIQPNHLHRKAKGGRSICRPISLKRMTYFRLSWRSGQSHLIVKGMMRSLANVHCELFVPPPNGVVLFKDAS